MQYPAIAFVAWLVIQGSVATAGSFPADEFPLTDTARSSVRFEEIRSGGPPRDGIPAIDAPTFVAQDVADTWLSDTEPVVSLVIGDRARAYPLQILMYHEIVNDTFAGRPVAVTFCPLCNASIVFDRLVSGKLLDFGTTGRLRKSDLVMYDRQSESWWQQFTGRGIIGQYAGTQLDRVPSQIVSYAAFKAAWPAAKILSRDTGYRRPYGSNPYRGYDHIDNNPFLLGEAADPRLPAMARVLAIPDNSATRLVPLSVLGERKLLAVETSQGRRVVLAADSANSALDRSRIAESRQIPSAAAFIPEIHGRALDFYWAAGGVTDVQTGSRWNVFGEAVTGKLEGERLTQVDNGVHFAFAWLAFDPGAIVIGASRNGSTPMDR